MADEPTLQLAYYITAGGLGAAVLGVIALVAAPVTCRTMATLGFFGGLLVALGHPGVINFDLALIARLSFAVSTVALAGVLPEVLLLIGLGGGARSALQDAAPGLRLALVFLALFILGPRLFLGVFKW